MNSSSNAVPDSTLQVQVAERRATLSKRPLLWSIRREIWEYRSIYIAPAAVAGFVIFGFFLALTLPRRHWQMGSSNHPPTMADAYSMSELFVMGATFLVSIFYCLDALYGERRDRSVLFWKSLPVSDLTVVLSKASIPLLVLPLVTFGITVVLQIVMLLMSTIAIMVKGGSLGSALTAVPLFRTWALLFYHLITVHALWYAPFYGYLLFVSSWAKRAPFLWAVLPPFIISLVEKLALNTSYFVDLLKDRLGSAPGAMTPPGSTPLDLMTQLRFGEFLASPGLWGGLLVTALFLAAAVQVRRYRGPI